MRRGRGAVVAVLLAACGIGDTPGAGPATPASIDHGAPPRARLTSLTADGAAVERVTLDASGSACAGPCARFVWSFGDGAVEEGGPGPLEHAYAFGGRYTVRVTVF